MAEKLSFAQRYATYTGKTLGSYYLEQLSAERETGPVFLARRINIPTRQLYHLRFLALPADLTAEDRLIFLGHFQREGSLVAALQHPALVPLNDYGIFEGVPYLVSPYLAAHSLQSMVVGNGPLNPPLVGRYLDKIAAALEYMHQQGLLHLDLHASNIFVSPAGDLLVAEAGLPRLLMPSASVPIRQDRLENGSPLLKDQQGRPLCGLSLASAPAPELLLGRSPGPFTDVYALGALLYYLLTGHRAFRAQTLAELAEQHLQAVVPPLSTWRHDLSGRLDSLLGSAMEKNPARRLRTPGALANAYASIVTPGQSERKAFVMPAAPVLSSTPAPVPRPLDNAGQVPALSRRRVITLLAAGGGVALAAGVTALVVTHNGSSAAPIAGTGGTSSTPGTTNGAGGNAPTPGNSNSGTPTPAQSGHSGTVVARVADVPPNSAKTFPLPNSNNPGVLIHLPNNSFVAFNSTCTHAGCAVAYSQQNHLLVCPCHDAKFDPARNAAVVSGPAPTPLASVPITVNSDGTITTPE